MAEREEKLRLVLAGLHSAEARYTAARTQQAITDIFVAVSEGLWWSIILQKMVAGLHNQEEPPLLRGLRYARNRIAYDYDLTDLLYMSGGAAFPMQFPISFYEWRWKPLKDLPAPHENFRNREGEEDYESELADRPARLTLLEVSTYFDEILSD